MVAFCLNTKGINSKIGFETGRDTELSKMSLEVHWTPLFSLKATKVHMSYGSTPLSLIFRCADQYRNDGPLTAIFRPREGCSSITLNVRGSQDPREGS